ncbi:hypothetical protein GCM10027046_09710 [Uliginosibacterium flavum]|uniref:DUF5610 domain-containing protein n=1 Tax=Uliginosibacterium flavum TaxID=1396831 RepID=A0ABV2TKZ5_9RHOO
MSMPIAASNQAQSSEARSSDAAPKPSAAAQARAQQNAAIVQASADVAISSGNDSLALLYKTAIDSINENLKAEFGDNALQAAMSQDNTPDGTAGRIVSLSTGFFEAFKAQHAGEDEAEVLKNFMATIRSGFERGFQEASDILQSLNVLNGDIASNIDKTYELVLQGYADFEAAQSNSNSQ